MMSLRSAVCFSICLISTTFLPAVAKVSLPPVFGDGAVLQRSQPVSVWGSAAPHESISVKIGKQNKTTSASGSGQWSVKLDPLSAAADQTLTVSSSANTLTRHVQIGDVLFCSGQSNMNISIVDSDCTDEEKQSPETAGVSVFRVKDKDSGQYSGSWIVPDAKSIDYLPAIPFLVGRRLASKSHVPVGVICAAASGAGIESFLAPETVGKVPHAGPNPQNRFPVSRNFKVLLEPYLPYTVRALLWYQGESNVLQTAAYKATLPVFLTDVRTRIGNQKLPVHVVQLPGFGPYVSNPQTSSWAEVREGQAAVTSLPNVFMTVAMDTAQDADLHPREKRVIAERLADALGSKWSAPIKNAYTVHGDAIKVDIGDKTQIVHTDNQEEARGFQIAGANKVFYKATADVSDHSITVKSDKVQHPVSVRYGWADGPDCNVKIGDLPLPPFRADSWAH